MTWKEKGRQGMEGNHAERCEREKRMEWKERTEE